MQSRTHSELQRSNRVVTFASDLEVHSSKSLGEQQDAGEAADLPKPEKKERKKKSRLWVPRLKKQELRSNSQIVPNVLDVEKQAQRQNASFLSKVRGWRCCINAMAKDDFPQSFQKLDKDDAARSSDDAGVRQHTRFSDEAQVDDEFSHVDAEGSTAMFTWMFVFKVPTKIGRLEQTWFSMWLRYWGQKGSNIVNCAFKFVEHESVKKTIVESELKFEKKFEKLCDVDVANMATLLQPLISSADKSDPAARTGSRDEKERNRKADERRAQHSYCRAQQCTIEIFLGFLEFLNASMREAFGAFNSLTSTPQVENGHTKAKAVTKEYFTSNDRKRIFFCVRCEKEIAESFADAKEYPLQLEEAALRKYLHLKDLPRSGKARKIMIHGATGRNQELINGHYNLNSTIHAGKPCWRRQDGQRDGEIWLYWVPESGWRVSNNKGIATSGWLRSVKCDDEGDATLPTDVSVWEVYDGESWECQPVTLEKEDDGDLDISCSAFCQWLFDVGGEHRPAYVKFDTSNRKYFKKYSDQYRPNESTVLQEIDRIRLVLDRITDDVNLHLLAAFGLIEGRFPLHNQAQLEILRSKWGSPSHRDLFLLTFTEPLGLIRRYFGEEVAFHFLFMQVLTRFLGFLVFPAVICAALLYLKINPKSTRVAFVSILMIWYRWLKKHWERIEAEYAIAWGIDAHKYSGLKVLTNSRFHNSFSEVLVDMSDKHRSTREPCKECGEIDCQCEKDFKRRNVPFVNALRQFRGSVLSFICTLSCIILLLYVVKVEIQWFLDLFTDERFQPYQRFAFSFLGAATSVQIFVVDGVWSFLASYITDLEYIEDEYTYNRSKSVKVCIVRFINMSVSMIYTAFVLPLYSPDTCAQSETSDDDDDSVCMQYFKQVLPIQFIMVLLTRFLLLLFVNNVVSPHFLLKWKYPEDAGELEKQAFMLRYQGTQIDEDFLHILIPVCFYALFGIMMPEVVLLLFLVCVAQKRFTAFKLVFYYQRPYPHLTRNINFHNEVLGFFGYLMIASNLLLISIHFSDVAHGVSTAVLKRLPSYSSAQEAFHWSYAGLCVFLLALLILVFLWRLVDLVIPAESSKVKSENHLHAQQIYKVFYRADVMKDLDTVPALDWAEESLLRRTNFAEVKTWRPLQAYRKEHGSATYRSMSFGESQRSLPESEVSKGELI